MKRNNEIILSSSTRGLVKAVKALKTVTRIKMINLLIIRECCVCEVSQALQISQTATSRNLCILLDAGFLKMRKEGLRSIYSLDQYGMPDCLSKLTEAVKLALSENNAPAHNLKRLKTAFRSASRAQNGNNAYSAANRTHALLNTRKRGL